MNCACGRPLHYQDKSIEAMVRYQASTLGDTITVKVQGRSFEVQRHFIALHGVKANELLEYGLEEVYRRAQLSVEEREAEEKKAEEEKKREPFMTHWVIYRAPKDFPVGFVVRQWRIYHDSEELVPEGEAILALTLEEARSHIPPWLYRLGRFANDDPAILEVWV